MEKRPDKRPIVARVPVPLEYPDEMGGTIAAVLGGEYECHYFGEKLTILDIGANVGSFALWANLRWPQSTIIAYEPNPETHAMLVRNVQALPNVICHHAAVYPGERKEDLFWSRYPGDGEGGLCAYMDRTFRDLPAAQTRLVPVIHPRDLPRCDVMKLDVEGAEAAILEAADLEGVSAVMLEYQNADNRRAIERRLAPQFVLEHEDHFPWRPLLPGSGYRRDLQDDSYGHLFFTSRQAGRLRRLGGPEWSADGISHLTLKQLLGALPGAAKKALKRRLAVLRRPAP
jgi:FkbM family methyltransferase